MSIRVAFLVHNEERREALQHTVFELGWTHAVEVFTDRREALEWLDGAGRQDTHETSGFDALVGKKVDWQNDIWTIAGLTLLNERRCVVLQRPDRMLRLPLVDLLERDANELELEMPEYS